MPLQIMRVFASGNDRSTFVNVFLQGGQAKSISLRQLSQMDEVVHTELYIGLIQHILREMPVVTPHPPCTFPTPPPVPAPPHIHTSKLHMSESWSGDTQGHLDCRDV